MIKDRERRLESRRAYDLEYRQRMTPEKLAEVRAKRAEAERRRRAANPEKYREARNRWEEKNPDHKLVRKRNAGRKRAIETQAAIAWKMENRERYLAALREYKRRNRTAQDDEAAATAAKLAEEQRALEKLLSPEAKEALRVGRRVLKERRAQEARERKARERAEAAELRAKSKKPRARVKAKPVAKAPAPNGAEARLRVLRSDDVYFRVDQCVGRGLPPHMRDDVISELFIMVLEGTITLEEVPANVRKVSGALRRDEWATVSIDAPLRGSPDLSLHDRLTTEAEAEEDED